MAQQNPSELNIALYPRAPIDQAEAVAWVFTEKHTPVQEYPFKFPQIQDDEIRIQQDYTGLCATDTHIANEEWGPTVFPKVCGHEIVGKVVAKGQKVVSFNIGERVGLGFVNHNCGECVECLTGNDQLCLKAGTSKSFVHGPQFGGFATHVQTKAHWAFSIPKSLPEETVPPLMCAGVTVFAPLKRFFNKKHVVGIVGIGGLGHLAIQFADKLGFKEVVAISTNQDKEAECKKFGASKFLNSKDADAMQKAAQSIDLIILTATDFTAEEFQVYLNLAKKVGRIVFLGIPPAGHKMSVSGMGIIANQISISGSSVGNRQEHMDTLEFAALHKILPTVEVFPAKDFQKSIDRLESGKARYRCVVDLREYAAKCIHNNKK